MDEYGLPLMPTSSFIEFAPSIPVILWLTNKPLNYYTKICINCKSAACKQTMICYNDLTMLHATPIDISANPELLRIAEEVATTKTPRELKRDNQTVAVIMPARLIPVKKAREKTIADYEAFKSAAGGWKDVNTDKLLADIYVDRRRNNSRAPIKL